MPRKKNQIVDQASIEIQNTAEIPITDQVDIKEVESETQLETTQSEIVQSIKEFSKPKRKITKLIETICGPKTIIVEVDE